MSSYYFIRVFILLHTCPDTTIYVSAYTIYVFIPGGAAEVARVGAAGQEDAGGTSEGAGSLGVHSVQGGLGVHSVQGSVDGAIAGALAALGASRSLLCLYLCMYLYCVYTAA